MLTEYRQMYEQSASFIENWKSKSKSELCRGYIENEHHPLLADAYFSAIVLKYWNMISRYYNRNTYIATLEDCYNWVIDSILYVLKTRKWADPTTKLGQDPNGADKAINRKIKCTWLTYCQSLNKDKRRINVDLLSLDGIQEGFDDVFVMENDDTDETSMIDLEYKVKANCGHASSPKPRSSIGIISDACHEVEMNPFDMKLTEPVSKMFDTLGRHSNFLYRMIFANLWAFGGVISYLGKKNGGELNALIRTTVAFTQARGSKATNVMPTEASMVSNIRLNPDDTVESTVEYIKGTINDDRVELNVLNGYNPSRTSRTDCIEFEKVERAVASTWRGCLVTPYLMVQCSDSRHYGRISDRVYRFSAMDMTDEERKSIHASNERIRLETIAKSCEFYLNLIRQL